MVVGVVEGEIDFEEEVELDVAMCFSPKCHRARLTHTKKIIRNPLHKMIVLCFRKCSENEDRLSLGFMMKSYQASFPIPTENENNPYQYNCIINITEFLTDFTTILLE